MTPSAKPCVLVVEDEAALISLLRYNLEREGFRVIDTGDGEEALILAEEESPDIILLDWMLPSVAGIEVCRRLRRQPKTRDIPVIMLTARAAETDRVRGLDAGADDYVAKPFALAELVARVRAVLRRHRPGLGGETLVAGPLSMDLSAFRVKRNGRDIKLGPTEFRLLRCLLERRGRVMSREQLLDAVWGRDIAIELRTVDVHIRRLRKALNEGDAPDLIRTVRSAGYSLDLAGAEPASGEAPAAAGRLAHN